MAEKESINSVDFYALKHKLWVEAYCAALSCAEVGTESAALLADKAVEEFLKRFRSVL